MIINFKNSYLFIHIPKCAGESITELLTSDLNRGVQFLGKHDYLKKALFVMQEKINHFTTFTVVRNPFHQVVSFYEHLRKPSYMSVAELNSQYPGYRGFLTPKATCKLAIKLDFKTWVKEVYVKRKEYHRLHGNQLNWLVDERNILRVDKILRFEFLNQDFLKLQKELGIEGKLPQKNQSRQVNYADYYDVETTDIVYREFGKTIELFGYNLEPQSQEQENLPTASQFIPKIESSVTKKQQNSNSLNYYELGMLSIYKQDWETALSWYEKALSLEKKLSTKSKDSHHLFLGGFLVKNGKFKEVIDCYHRVFQEDIQNLKFYYQFSIHLSEAGLISEAVTFFKDLPKPQLPKNLKLSKDQSATNSIYESIWNGLHQPNPEDFHLQIELESLELESGKIKSYFSQKDLKILLIDKLHPEDINFLESCGILLEYIKLIRLENHNLENIYINCFENSNDRLQTRTNNVRKKHLKKKPSGYKYQAVEFTQSLVEFGYMYAICPLSGRVVRSNTSFYLGKWILIYRFQGEEVFYIIVNDFIGAKTALYIPKLNVCICFSKKAFKNIGNQIYNFQSYVVSNWKYVQNYLGNFNRSLVELYGTVGNLGHFFWQDITGIYYLYEQNLLEKIDYFCAGDYQYLNLLSIFPEIPENKVLNISGISTEDKFRFMLKNNFFCIRITDALIKQNVGNRVAKAAYNLCSEQFIKEVKKAKEDCNLLLWINVRSHNKIWLEQDKNYAKIIDKLRDEFSHLTMGVVFDGTPDASDIVKSIIEQTKSKVSFYNTTLDIKLHESLVWAKYIDAYIAVVGSGLVITSWLMDKPGVAHGDRAHLGQKCFWSEVKESGIEPRFLRHQEVKQSHKGVYKNYQIDWQIIYKKIFKILKKIERELRSQESGVSS